MKRNKILKYGITLFMVLVIANFIWGYLSSSNPADIGNSFTVLNTLITACAFGGLLYTINIQLEDRKRNRAEDLKKEVYSLITSIGESKKNLQLKLEEQDTNNNLVKTIYNRDEIPELILNTASKSINAIYKTLAYTVYINSCEDRQAGEFSIKENNAFHIESINQSLNKCLQTIQSYLPVLCKFYYTIDLISKSHSISSDEKVNLIYFTYTSQTHHDIKALCVAFENKNYALDKETLKKEFSRKAREKILSQYYEDIAPIVDSYKKNNISYKNSHPLLPESISIFLDIIKEHTSPTKDDIVNTLEKHNFPLPSEQ